MSSDPSASLDQGEANGIGIPDTAGLRARDDRLSSMKAMVGRMAHSFNNALAPLTGYVALLSDELQAGSPGKQYLSRFEGSVGKAEALVTGILQATHPERNFVPKQTDFTALLQRATESWLKSLPPSSQISVQWAASPCTLCVDENQWLKVIDELLRNAQSALCKGGTLAITLAAQSLSSAEAAALGLRSTEVFLLAFHDTGSGMPRDVLRRAFEPLFTTRPRGATAGLGLTLVHSVVQLHGGQVALDSAEEVGTQVRIWLPADQS